jgi:hypothetical protein
MPRKSKSIQDAADRAERTSAGLEEDYSDREFKTPGEPSGAGRPSEYKPRFCQVAATLASGGCTDEEIAEELSVSVRTLYRWKAQYPELCQAIEAGREANIANMNSRVKGALLARAVGYTFDTVKVFNNQGTPLVVPIKEHVPPDVSAIKYWLENRTEDWKSSPSTQVNNLNLDMSDIDKLALARWIANELAQATAEPKALVEDKDD